MGIISDIKNKFIKNKKTCGAIIVAAGKGSRMNSQQNKLFVEFGGVPVLAYTLLAFEDCADIDKIVVVSREQDFLTISDISRQYDITKLKSIIKGGAKRQDSVLSGVMEFDGECDYLCVHDGVRPFIRPKDISAAIYAAMEHRAAAVGVYVKDTIKLMGQDDFIKDTLEREKLVAIQTPQVFEAQLLKQALLNASEKDLKITDDCMAVEALGLSVKVVLGSYYNIKITTDEDLAICEAIVMHEYD